ncbi:Holliday junction resolvase RuvX [Patescibacteria group bacterium]
MKYLGIDFGLKNLGLAVAETPLAEPFGQHHYQQTAQAIEFLARLVKEQNIQTIVLGLPEGQLESVVKDFGNQLFLATNLPIFYQDETLSTIEAKQKLLQAHKPQKKRRQDHQAAAAVILQAYLDQLEQA